VNNCGYWKRVQKARENMGQVIDNHAIDIGYCNLNLSIVGSLDIIGPIISFLFPII